MSTTNPGRRTMFLRPFVVLAPALLAGLPITGALAMWQRMTDAELLAASAVVVEGEWVGQGRVSVAGQTVDIGIVKVAELLQGSLEGSVAFVALPPPDRPISSSDLRFKRGDRGLWFLKRPAKADAASPLVIDHPQRFVADLPDNAAALAAWRQKLKRR